MKKVFLPVVLLCLATTMFAQKSNISKAKVKAFNVEAPDFKGAKELMDAALVHPETKDDIKTKRKEALTEVKAAQRAFDELADRIEAKKAMMSRAEKIMKRTNTWGGMR